jgi:hypothetical protein
MKRCFCLFLVVMASVLTKTSAVSARSIDDAMPAVNMSEKALNLIYDPNNGGLRISLIGGENTTPPKLSTLLIQSNSNDFTGEKPVLLFGALDDFQPSRLFKIDTNGFGPTADFGTPLASGKTPDHLMQSLSVTGSMMGGGSLEQIPVHLIHPAAVPEPTGLLLLGIGILAFVDPRRRD